jgi:hypothetical protein
MKPQLGSTLKKQNSNLKSTTGKVALAFTLTFIFNLTMLFGREVAAEQKMATGDFIYLEMKIKKSKIPKTVRIRVKDRETGKSATINLSPSTQNPRIALGFFALQFDENGTDIEKLDFFIKNRKLTPFSPGPNSKKTHRVFLFKSARETANFAIEFLKDDKSKDYPHLETGSIEAQGIKAVPLPVPLVVTPTPVVIPTIETAKEVPKEIPKAEPLAAKTEEIQRQENLAKLDLETIEAQKRANELEKLALLKEDEKKIRKDKAQDLANKASLAYKNGDYKTSVALYSQATNLDPESDTFYFQHGVALYKLGDYKKSLATLSMAEGQTENRNELTYFKALNHMKLEEYDQALEEFTAIQEENDESLSSTAAFFAGNIAFRKEKYPEARKSLEYTLDHSKDPKTDKQAEELIEEIDRIEAFISRTKEIFRYSLTAGAGYDQNILNVATQNTAINKDGYRASYGGSFLYRFLYDYRNEFSSEFNLNNVYTVKKNFEVDTSLQAADPLVLSLGLPYHRQSLIAKRSITWGVTPQYQTILMSLDGGARSEILSSNMLKFDANFMYNAKWMSAYRAEYSMDTSGLSAASADDNLSGTKSTLGMTQTRLLDQRGTQTWNYSLEYSSNEALGKNYQYNKWSLGLGFADKVLKDHDGTLKLDYSSLDYARATTPRADNLLGLTATMGKEYWPATYVTYSAQYNLNSSNVSIYQYDKFVLNFSVAYSGSKKRK